MWAHRLFLQMRLRQKAKMGPSKVNGSEKVSGIVRGQILPYLQANKLACQLHGRWQKIQVSWVTEKRQLLTAITVAIVTSLH